MRNVKFNKKKAFITVPFNAGTVQIFADYATTIDGYHFFIHKQISEVKDGQAEYYDKCYTLTEFSTGIDCFHGSKTKVVKAFLEVLSKPENSLARELQKYEVLNLDADNYIENTILSKPKKISNKPTLKDICITLEIDRDIVKPYFEMVEMFCKMSDISPKFFIETDSDGLYYIAVRHNSGEGKMYIQECYVSSISVITDMLCHYYKTEFTCQYSEEKSEAIAIQPKAKIQRKKAVKIAVKDKRINEVPKVAIKLMPKKRKAKKRRLRNESGQEIRQSVNDTIAAMQAIRVLFWQILHPLIHYPPEGFFTLNLATIKQNVHNAAQRIINTNLQTSLSNITNAIERSNTNKFRLHWSSS